MSGRARNRALWMVVALVVVVTVLYFSESAMTWLRVTLHGR
jgi:hypothetical protein